MRRRDLIAAGTLGLAASSTGSALAGPTGGTAPAAAMNIAGLGLPVITEGRLRNYVFVSLRLSLGGGATPEQMRAKEPFLRDAIVKAAHRTPFVVADDWTVIDGRALCAAVVRMAVPIAGAGKIVRAEVTTQTPRRRTGLRGT